MTTRKSNAKAAKPKGDRPVTIHAKAGELPEQTSARLMLAPYLRHGVIADALADKMIGKDKLPGAPRFDDYGVALKKQTAYYADGNLRQASAMLAAQAVSLDAIFTEYARRSINNCGQYIDASERYMRIALKAQANSRQAIEALAKLHSPREQTVRHVHVNEGGQAVIADQFHHHAGGQKNGETVTQPHAPENGAAGTGPALPCPNPIGESVPISGGEGGEAMPNAWGQGKRRAKG